MLKNSPAFSSFSVNDVAQAKTFYGDTLGLAVEETPMTDDDGQVYPLLTLHLANKATIMLYPKPNHAPASFTVLNFPVTDIETVVDKLTRGVCALNNTRVNCKRMPKALRAAAGH